MLQSRFPQFPSAGNCQLQLSEHTQGWSGEVWLACTGFYLYLYYYLYLFWVSYRCYLSEIFAHKLNMDQCNAMGVKSFSTPLQIIHKQLHLGRDILIQTACTQVNHIHSGERQLFLIYMRLTPIIRSSICTIRGDTHTNLEQRQMKTFMMSLLIKILPKNSRFLILLNISLHI